MVDDQVSHILPVSSDLLQGSVLGLLLFLAHVNDLIELVSYPYNFLQTTVLSQNDTRCAQRNVQK